jgi:hypothetical protein
VIKKAKQCSYTKQFVDHYAANAKIKSKWKDNFSDSNDNKTASEVIDSLATQYELITDHTAMRLVLQYQCFTPAGKMSWKTLASNKSILSYQICQSVGATHHSVCISDLYLKVQRKKDDEYERDVSCDSDFMKDNMVQVGQVMREKFQWVDASTPLYLVMDNAGGHGKKDIIEAYQADLWNKFKVKIVHQIP